MRIIYCREHQRIGLSFARGVGSMCGLAVGTIVLSCFLTSAAVAVKTGIPTEELLRGVREIGAPGVPGTVAVFGPRAEALVLGKSGRGYGAVVAAARLGRGRVVAFGHGGYFDAKMLTTADSGRLVSQLARWAANARKDARAVVAGAPGLAAFLENHGFTVKRVGRNDLGQTDLARIDLVSVSGHAITSAKLGRKLRAFVADGGGLLICATGWGWAQLNPGKRLSVDWEANHLLAPAGLAFTGAMTKRTSKKGFVIPAAVDGSSMNASEALDRLLRQAHGEEKISPEEVGVLSGVVLAAARAISIHDTLLRPRIEALLADNRQPIVPTRKHPLKASAALERIVVSLDTERLEHMPPEKMKAHPAAADFPGAVPAAAPRVTATVSVDTAVPRWHSTGLYAAPGELVRVAVPPEAADKGLKLRIGCHKDGIWQRPAWWRYPEITRVFPIRESEIPGACAFGGLVYIEVPRNCTLGVIPVRISGALRAPLYIEGETTAEDWRKTIQRYPAPWAELAARKVIITVPSKVVRQLDDPASLMSFWDGVLDACADLAVRPRERRSPERYVTDRQISVGYMHSGYPIMTFLDAAPRFVNLERLRRRGDWGMFHEMGHNHQSPDWTFAGTVEVTVNLFSLYVLETCCPGAPKHPAISGKKRDERIRKYLAGGARFEEWKRNPFTALCMYVQLQEAFGWDAYKKVFAEYRRLPAAERPKTDAEKRDQWLVRMSRTVGRNLGPFFQAWGVPTSARARESLVDLPVWMPGGFPPPPKG